MEGRCLMGVLSDILFPCSCFNFHLIFEQAAFWTLMNWASQITRLSRSPVTWPLTFFVKQNDFYALFKTYFWKRNVNLNVMEINMTWPLWWFHDFIFHLQNANAGQRVWSQIRKLQPTQGRNHKYNYVISSDHISVKLELHSITGFSTWSLLAITYLHQLINSLKLKLASACRPMWGYMYIYIY